MRLLALLLSVALSCGAAEQPLLLGYGVKECRDYNQAFRDWQAQDEAALSEYLRYRGWLAGLVSGLSLATGMDVLKGVELTAAMRSIQVYCDEHPDDDFFAASMDLVKALGAPGDRPQ